MKYLLIILWLIIPVVATAQFTCGDTLVDARDGQKYPTVQIGNQCWMAKNINIGTFKHAMSALQDNGIIEKYCYNDDTLICDTLGGIYEWDEMMQYDTAEGVQGICPPGWHIPTEDEWDELLSQAGVGPASDTFLGKGGASGFEAQLGGLKSGLDGNFYNIGSFGYYLSSTQVSATEAYSYVGFNPAIPQNNQKDIGVKYIGVSVRCMLGQGVGVEYLKSHLFFSLSPNPAGSTVVIHISGMEDDLSLEIYDITGKLMHDQQQLNHREEIDISHLQQGICIFRISNGTFFQNKILIKK